ncbi:DUF2971 domain-containing protein [Rhizobium leguminosarum bv. viciae]|uniref:DUF2971 domain-containing protein n=1 Tax=Rhizobium leguminosarum TaxID=384 RepID=UPI00140FC2A6|nr:DUF2971 domain-containing protein [Rhizobium leguminosarum]NKJ97099.1 DUF2971 domain-containing protein [Rhizobium leguminosarum bv. viciae]QIO58190.1 DUF2971 domain-containing protein [Rhizobium leguminosarum bv. trifolii]
MVFLRGMMVGSSPFYTDDFMAEVMGVEALPERLFHYTSIDTLEKILINHTLRFGRLDQVNDPEEAQSDDVPLAATSLFVSCWSSNSVESIPLWSLYGGGRHGVRLSMPVNMFAGRHKPTIFEVGGALTIVDAEMHIMRKSPAMSTTMSAAIGPNKVYYTDDIAFRVRPLIMREGGKARYTPYDLGMAKSTAWAYEEEWRFKIAALSFASEFPDDEYFNKVTLDLDTYPVETNQLFVPLDPSSLDELKVTAGPLVTADEFARIETLLAQHASNAELTRSAIAMRPTGP